MNRSKNILPLVQQCVRQFSRTPAKNSEAVQEVPSKAFKSLKEKQKRFQIEDGKPVYLKGGQTDRLLYLTTLGLCFVGTAMAGEVFYKLAVK